MISKKPSKPAGVEIWLMDEHEHYAISLDGVVRFVGSRAECEARAKILTQPNTRKDQDSMLHRAVGR